MDDAEEVVIDEVTREVTEDDWNELIAYLTSVSEADALLRSQMLAKQYQAEYGPWLRKQRYIKRLRGHHPRRCQRYLRH